MTVIEICSAMLSLAFLLAFVRLARGPSVADRVRHRFHLLAKGSADPSAFNFTYEFPLREGADTLPLSLSFKVTPESLPPTNIHVLIGRNGVGKTTCATALALRAAERSQRTLLLSTDPAGALGDMVGVRLGPEPAPVPFPEQPRVRLQGPAWSRREQLRREEEPFPVPEPLPDRPCAGGSSA